MSKFTAGPWELEYDGDDCFGAFTLRMATAIENRGMYDYVHCIELYQGLWSEDGEAFEEAGANSRLIASAPDMLAALTAMVNDEAFADLCQGIGEEPEWLRQAKLAIEKATV